MRWMSAIGMLDTAEIYGDARRRRAHHRQRTAGVRRRATRRTLHRQQGAGPATRRAQRHHEAPARPPSSAWVATISTSICCTGRGRHPFAETLRGFHDLIAARNWSGNIGVSNFDIDDTCNEWRAGAGRRLGLRGSRAKPTKAPIDWISARGIELRTAVMAACARHIDRWRTAPLGQRFELTRHPAVACGSGASAASAAAQIALAWCLREPDVTAIPKSVDPVRIEDNLRAAELRLTGAELERIDQAFPPPHSKRPLEMV
jgi:hypothetical protein